MKKTLDGINVLYPTPTVLVGAMVAGKPNYITIAHIGIVNHARPYLISLSSAKAHYTNAGIKENKAFSVNIPSENLVVETDYVGLVSGKKTDKSELFEIFHGNDYSILRFKSSLSTPPDTRNLTPQIFGTLLKGYQAISQHILLTSDPLIGASPVD